MNKQSLLEVAPLLEGELLEQRQELKKNIVKYTLSQERFPTEFTLSRVTAYSDSNFGIKIETSAAASTLGELQEEQLVKHVHESKYEIVEKPETISFNKLADPVWNEFCKILAQSDNDIDIHYLDRNMENSFKDFLLEFFLDISGSFEALNEHQIDTLYSKDLEDLIDKSASSHEFQNESAYKRNLKEYLQNPREQEELLKFTDKTYRGIVNIDLLSREGELDFPPISDIPQKNRMVILDTNVLVNLLCKTDNLHPIASTVCETSLNNGLDLVYLEETKEELNRLLQGAENEMSGIYDGDKKISTADTQFVKDFQRSDEAVSWDEYISKAKEWKDTVRELGITELDCNYKPNQKVTENAKELLIEADDKISDGFIRRVNHDASMLGYAAQYRVRSRGNFGPFVLSFHNAFTETCNKLVQRDGLQGIIGPHPLGMQSRSWLNYLMSFSSAGFDEDNRRQVSLAILQGATKFDDSLSIQEYARLLVPKAGLKKEDEKHLGKYLREHPLSKELEKALERDDGQKAEDLSRQILTDDEYRQTIQEERDFGKRIKKASSRVNEMQSKLELKDNKINQLEEEIDKLKRNGGSPTINIQGGTAVANAEAEASVNVEFKQQYENIANEFAELDDEKVIDIMVGLPDRFDEFKLNDPPSESSSIPKKLEWLQTASAVLTLSDKIPEWANQLQPDVMELISMGIGIVS